MNAEKYTERARGFVAAADDTTADVPASDCTGDALLDCARASTIGDLVPDEAVAATGEPITIGMINQENTPAGSYPELSSGVDAAIAFVQPGESLNLVADLCIARQINWIHPTTADPTSCLHLGAIVFALVAFVHQSRGLPRDLPPQFRGTHEVSAVSPLDRRGASRMK